MSASKNNPHGLAVGQTLYYVSHRYSGRVSEFDVTVTSVGRKWASIAGTGFADARIDLSTLRADGRGYTSPGRCFLSKDAYQAEQGLQDAWDRFRNACGISRPPQGVTVDTIKQAAELLGLGWGA